MRRQQGFSYLIMLFAVAALSLLSLRAVENAYTLEQREREDALLWIGQAYRNAIAAYYLNSPGTVKTYPPDLDALLLDNRTATVQRALRRLYRDPITGGTEWGIVRTADGKVRGVYSLSPHRPLKTDGFSPEFASFAGASRYQDWQFVYEPPPEQNLQRKQGP